MNECFMLGYHVSVKDYLVRATNDDVLRPFTFDSIFECFVIQYREVLFLNCLE